MTSTTYRNEQNDILATQGNIAILGNVTNDAGGMGAEGAAAAVALMVNDTSISLLMVWGQHGGRKCPSQTTLSRTFTTSETFDLLSFCKLHPPLSKDGLRGSLFKNK